jgi:hypothetical protein
MDYHPVSQLKVEARMTINRIMIDPYDPAVIASMQLTTSFLASLMIEALDLIEATFCKHFDYSDRPRRAHKAPLEVLMRIQRVKIIFQNALFSGKSKIEERIETLPSRICTSHKEMIDVKEGLVNNMAMLDAARVC